MLLPALVRRAFSALFLSLPLLLVGQDITWPHLNEGAINRQADGPRIKPAEYRVVGVDTALVANFLVSVSDADVRSSSVHLQLPTPEGGEERFRIARSQVLHPELEERYPMIRTYVGYSTARPGVIARIELTPHGFHAMVMDPHEGDWFMDPFAPGIVEASIVYRKRHFSKVLPEGFAYCSYDQVNDLDAADAQMRAWEDAMGGARAGDCQKRTYRLALACTGEYANFHGSNTTNNNKSFALAAMATSMNRVNGIFERDMAITMVMVPNNDLLVFLNPSTDPYSNNNGSTMLGQNQTTCDNVIGSANYDIGHVFSTGGGGVAYLASVCNSSTKAGGVTGGSNPVNDPFDIDYVAHEIGHQFGARHTQNNNCNRSNIAAYEPGSASTIMGYAGICSPNVQNNSDALFHAYSIQEMTTFVLGSGGNCAQVTPSGNQQPTVSAGPNRTIPRSTPFVLAATASDPDPGTQLTYTWEQFNNQISTQPPQSTNTGGPNFRALLPGSDPSRWFPNLNAVVNNQDPTWEVLSSVSRTFNFRVTVRDNFAQAGCTSESNRAITVTADAGPFLVTQPNTNVSWVAGSNQTVTWSVANTTAAPVSCSAVDILLSVDGGFTYPYTLATATPNDGSEQVQIPLAASGNAARIMVRANNNVFYDISNTNFTIAVPTTPDYFLVVPETSVDVCKPENAVFTVETGAVAGYSQPITLGVVGLATGLTANFSVNPVTPGGTSTLTVSGTASQQVGPSPFTLTASSASGGRTEDMLVNIKEAPGAVVRTAPLNGATAVLLGTALEWEPLALAGQYTIQVATDPDMSDLVESGMGITDNTFTLGPAIAPQATYYWAVQAVNTCGFGPSGVPWSFTTAACVPVTVQITTDRYGDETTWQVRQGSAIYASGGPYNRLSANGTQVQPSVELCLPAGCFELVVFDSWGDGNCCAYGAGFVRVVDAANEVLANVSANNFGQANPAIAPFCVSTDVLVDARVWLDGAYNAQDGLMADALRVLGLIPLQEPYTALGLVAGGGGNESVLPAVLAATGPNAIVDWVRLELRSPSEPSVVVAARNALLQRDGDIVDTDGTSSVAFQIPPGNYHLAVRHRNHLGCMTASAIEVGASPVSVDLRLAGTATFGADARRVAGGSAFLWAGNSVLDDKVSYTGNDNDRDAVLVAIGGTVPTATITGYLMEDVNLDGTVSYTGGDNDRDRILQSIGGVVPTDVRIERLP